MEPQSNLFMTCGEHSAKPNPNAVNYPPEWYIGKWVKLGFDAPPESGNRKEHLWVRVLEKSQRSDYELKGVTDNDPVVVDIPCGTAIDFTRDEVEAALNEQGEWINL